MVGQDPPYKLLPPQVGESQNTCPHAIVKKKKKQELHKTKDKITRIFQLLSIKVRNNRRKSNESGDLDRIFCIVDKSVGKKWAKAL
ncbi:hypothetical protein ACI3PX_02030 [Glaesserella parasuis]|uniref:hypothetical protein n=1 Tax=Glaesserella parasuis TaxID=738 RepID=UPI0038544BFF